MSNLYRWQLELAIGNAHALYGGEKRVHAGYLELF